MKKQLLLTGLICFFCSQLKAQTNLILADYDGTDLNFSKWGGNVSFAIVPNPDTSGANTSTSVGEFTWGGPSYGIESAQLPGGVIDFGATPYGTMKIWSAKPIKVELQFQNFSDWTSSAVVSYTLKASQTNKWVQLAFDFTGVTKTDLDRVVLFLDRAGIYSADQDKIYFDDIQVSSKKPVIPLLDVMLADYDGTNLTFSTWGGSGSFAKVANPHPSGVNTSTNVGKFAWGGVTYGIESAQLPGGAIDFSVTPYGILKIWSPKPIKVELQFQAFSDWTSSAVRSYQLTESQTNQWVELAFDFTGVTKTNLDRVVLFLDRAGTFSKGQDKYYFDDIRVSDEMPVMPAPDVMLANYDGTDLTFSKSGGNVSFAKVANPHAFGVNTSGNVGKFAWGGVTYGIESAPLPGGAINFGATPYGAMKIWSAKPILVELQFQASSDRTSSAVRSYQLTESLTNKWVELGFDFSRLTMTNLDRVVLFLDRAGTFSTGQDNYYFDDIRVSSQKPPKPPVDRMLADYDGTDLTFSKWGGNVSFAIVPNPDTSGANTSGNVSEFTWGGQTFGMESAQLPGGAIDFSGTPYGKMKIWSANPILVELQFQNFGDWTSSAVRTYQLTESQTNQWVQLLFDFTGLKKTDLDRVVLFLDRAGIYSADQDKYYFDDIEVVVPHPPFDVTHIAVSLTEVALTWTSVPSATYTIEGTTSVSDPTAWAVVAQDIPSGGTTTAKSVPRDNANAKFYRVKNQP